MTDARSPLVSIVEIEKDYRSLRPLRLKAFELREAQAVAVLGLDQVGAEVLVNLIAGATLPDRGEVIVRGRSTHAITNGDDWMRALDDFGIVTERAILLEQMTAEQNLAVPFSLELHELPGPVREKVVALAAEVGLGAGALVQFTSTLAPLDRMRVRLARAIAGNPRILLAEHPNASLAADDLRKFAADLARVVAARRLALLVLTADRAFASAVADEVFTLSAVTGELSRVPTGWRRWLGA